MNTLTPPLQMPQSAQIRVLEKVLATRIRDLDALDEVHREIDSAAPGLHQKMLRWMVRNEPRSPHIAVGLAILAVSPDVERRHFVRELIPELHVRTLAETVDYIHGWKVDHIHTKLVRKRFRDEMTEAYSAGGDLVRQTMGEDGQSLSDEMTGGEIVVTLGEFDKVQQVLDHLDLGYRVVPCKIVEQLPLRADQVLIINCPGNFTPEGIESIRLFVLRGGTLITTDWALDTTLSAAFPGIVEYNRKSTGDDVVEVSWVHPDSIYTRGVEVDGQKIRWWLEGSSYPIRILDDRVTVLVSSKQMKKRYGEEPLVVCFSYGEGMVFHLTSHYYLQRSQGDKSVKAQDVVKKTFKKASDNLLSSQDLNRVSGGQLAAAYSSMRLLANILYERRRLVGLS